MTYAGYILGFPTDTPESIARDIEIIKKELPVDILEFFYLTPLPGSEDHKNLFMRGVAMDPDMNKYDLEHACTAHPLMSKETWTKVYADAWTRYYTDEHVETIMRRAVVSGINRTKILNSLTIFSGASRIEGVHPLQFGFCAARCARNAGTACRCSIRWCSIRGASSIFSKLRRNGCGWCGAIAASWRASKPIRPRAPISTRRCGRTRLAARPIILLKCSPTRSRTPTARRRARLPRSAENLRSRRGVAADLAFRAADQPRDIGAVHDPQQHRQQQK